MHYFGLVFGLEVLIMEKILMITVLLSLSFTIFLSQSALTDEPTLYLGHGDYELIFPNSSDPSFNPKERIENPTSRTLEKIAIRNALQASMFSSLSPLRGLLSGMSTENNSLFQNLISVTSLLKNQLGPELKKTLSTLTEKNILPISLYAYIIPTINPPDQYYSENKIATEATHSVEIINDSINENSPEKLRPITQAIAALQRKQLTSKLLANLLGLILKITLDEKEVNLSLKILLSLTPGAIPLPKDSDKVYINQVFIPKTEEQSPVALLSLTNCLTNPDEDLKLQIHFGEFNQIENEGFSLKEPSQIPFTPILNGNYKYNGKVLKSVILDFHFNSVEITLNEKKPEEISVTELNILTVPKLKLGNIQLSSPLGLNLHIVETEFSKEITGNLQDETKKMKLQLSSDKEKILADVQSPKHMLEAITSLFGLGSKDNAEETHK